LIRNYNSGIFFSNSTRKESTEKSLKIIIFNKEVEIIIIVPSSCSHHLYINAEMRRGTHIIEMPAYKFWMILELKFQLEFSLSISLFLRHKNTKIASINKSFHAFIYNRSRIKSIGSLFLFYEINDKHAVQNLNRMRLIPATDKRWLTNPKTF
jgi:hypothetical protein